MDIAIVHNASAVDCPPDEQDVLVQVEAVSRALERLGHRVGPLPCDLNLEILRRRLQETSPDLIFNLVESLAETGRLIHVVPGLLDAMALPYTGASAQAIFLTSNKLLAKVRLHTAGLPTPAWIHWRNSVLSHCDRPYSEAGSDTPDDTSAWITKSVWEHASVGLDESAIVPWPGAEAMGRRLIERAADLGGDCFAEVFIDGREFNLSVLDGPRGPRVLPPAEILFSDFGEGKARIVDYQAKWDPASFEYHHTPRHFDFSEADRPLLDQLNALSLACWRLFDLKGYARVDFRVDERGNPWILEVNANPCLSPDAGFAAAVQQAGMTFETAIDRIVSSAKR
jgi:D-alanine-D-alanine ligase